MIIFSRLITLLDNIGWKFIYFISTPIMYIKMWMIGIRFKKGIGFYGLMKFKKAASAYIEIGTNCKFRSTPTTNLIGINRPCIISALSSDAQLIIGDNCGFSGTVIGCFCKITIGKNVRCGANTLITDSDWHLDDIRTGKPCPIIIENNVWLGVDVIVLKGVTIGENAVIGARSVVTRDIPSNVIAAGNPCTIIKKISL